MHDLVLVPHPCARGLGDLATPGSAGGRRTIDGTGAGMQAGRAACDRGCSRAGWGRRPATNARADAERRGVPLRRAPPASGADTTGRPDGRRCSRHAARAAPTSKRCSSTSMKATASKRSEGATPPGEVARLCAHAARSRHRRERGVRPDPLGAPPRACRYPEEPAEAESTWRTRRPGGGFSGARRRSPRARPSSASGRRLPLRQASSRAESDDCQRPRLSRRDAHAGFLPRSPSYAVQAPTSGGDRASRARGLHRRSSPREPFPHVVTE